MSLIVWSSGAWGQRHGAWLTRCDACAAVAYRPTNQPPRARLAGRQEPSMCLYGGTQYLSSLAAKALSTTSDIIQVHTAMPLKRIVSTDGKPGRVDIAYLHAWYH